MRRTTVSTGPSASRRYASSPVFHCSGHNRHSRWGRGGEQEKGLGPGGKCGAGCGGKGAQPRAARAARRSAAGRQAAMPGRRAWPHQRDPDLRLIRAVVCPHETFEGLVPAEAGRKNTEGVEAEAGHAGSMPGRWGHPPSAPPCQLQLPSACTAGECGTHRPVSGARAPKPSWSASSSAVLPLPLSPGAGEAWRRGAAVDKAAQHGHHTTTESPSDLHRTGKRRKLPAALQRAAA